MPEFDRFSLILDDMALPEGSALFIRATEGESTRVLGAKQLSCEQSFKPEYDRLMNASFSVETKAVGRFKLALVNATRSKAETLGNIARAWAMLENGGTLLVNADKSEGADSLLKHLRANLPVAETFSKSHGRLIRLAKTTEPAPDWAKDLQPATNADGFWSVPGCFSADKVDAGSRLLAGHLGRDLKGRIADLGAGWGYLSAQLLLAALDATEIHLFEAEAKALDCARLNVTDAKVQFHWADVATMAKAEPFDAVICNPPFHSNRAADPSLGNAFIAAAARILKPSGKAWFVANRNLPYEATLAASFIKVTRMAQDSGFKVFLCERPKSGRR